MSPRGTSHDSQHQSGELTPPNITKEAALRQLMYQRIARGNALSQAEDNARRKWRGRQESA